MSGAQVIVVHQIIRRVNWSAKGSFHRLCQFFSLEVAGILPLGLWWKINFFLNSSWGWLLINCQERGSRSHQGWLELIPVSTLLITVNLIDILWLLAEWIMTNLFLNKIIQPWSKQINVVRHIFIPLLQTLAICGKRSRLYRYLRFLRVLYQFQTISYHFFLRTLRIIPILFGEHRVLITFKYVVLMLHK